MRTESWNCRPESWQLRFIRTLAEDLNLGCSGSDLSEGLFWRETALTKTRSYRHWIECAPYSDVKTCTKEYHPLCATNGCTYCNECFFCDALKLLTYSPIKETPQPAGVVGKADTVPGAAELALHGPLCRRKSWNSKVNTSLNSARLLVGWAKGWEHLKKWLSSHQGSELFSSLSWYYLFVLKLVLHVQKKPAKSQTVMCTGVIYFFAPEKWIQSVEPMANRTPIPAYSAVKS